MRKRNLSIWLSAGFCLFIFSCTTRNNGETYNTDEITYRVGTSKDLGEEVDSIRYLPLLKSDQHLVSEATKLRVKNNRIVIFEKKTHRVVSYDTNGHFLYEINHRGKGNKEYLEIANITVTANYIYLLDNFKHKLNVYDIKDGSFVRSTDVPFVAWDLEAFDDNNLLFTMLENNPNGQVEANGHNYAVWRTDSLGKIIDSYLPYEKGYYEMIGKEVYFTVSGDNTIFHSFKKDGYYTFDSKGILKYTNMNFNRPIPRGTPIAYDDVAKEKYQYLSTTPYVTDDYVLAEIGQGNLSEIQLYNNKEKTFLQNSDESCVNAMVDVSGIWGQQFVSFIPDIETYKDLVSCGFKKADQTTEDCLNKGGQCLVIYRMK